MTKTNIIGMNEEELKGYCRTLGYKDFHGTQIFNWIYKKFPANFQEMTDISLELRKSLDESFFLEYLQYSEKCTSKKEDATKYCFHLAGDVSFESVALKGMNNRTSFCISSQAGCPIGCIYCATGKMGFLRIHKKDNLGICSGIHSKKSKRRFRKSSKASRASFESIQRNES